MNFNATFSKVILLENVSDQQKRTLIMKIVQHIAEKEHSYSEISLILETCLSTALENVSNKSTVLSLFAFASCGNKFPAILKEYMNIELISFSLAETEPRKLSIILMWLKEGLQILLNDTNNYISSISPILSGLLENKFIENGKHSAILSQISEMYLLCPSLLPPQHARLKFTVSIMHCVASFPIPTKPDTLKHMKNLGDLITMLWETLQLEDILSTLYAMYTIISNPDTSADVCPAMAHILSLVFPQVVEGLGPRIVSNPQSSNESFVATLVRLCSWLITWPTAHATLVHWIQTLVRLLYQSGRNIVPAKITYEQIPKLLDGLRIPVCRPGVLSVATILLMSFQYSALVFHKVIGMMVSMMECLRNECSDSAHQTLDGLSKLCHAQMVLYPGYPETYQPLMDVLTKYPTPSEEEIQSLIQEHNWVVAFKDSPKLFDPSKNLYKLLGASVPDAPPVSYHKRTPGQKVGLRNLGNTCYMNSVLQALLMTDDFRHSVLQSNPKCNERLLVKLQHLFTSLCFSHRGFVSPKAFHEISRPPWFSDGAQHDCSEYLRHLMSTLHDEERLGQKLPEYQERVIIESGSNLLPTSLLGHFDPLQKRIHDMRNCSPRDRCLRSNGHVENSEVDLKESSNDHSPEPPEDQIEVPVDLERKPDSSFKLNDSLRLDRQEEKDFINWRSGKSESPELDTNKECESVLPESSRENSVVSVKRKYTSSPVKARSTGSKSPKADNVIMSADTDNSSDSGISGDLPDELEVKGSQRNGVGGRNLHIELPPRDKFFIGKVHKVFGGKISTSIQCLKCKTKSIHRDVFTDINLAFQDNDQSTASSAIRKQPERMCNRLKTSGVAADLRIEDMIANYLTTETLTGENQYECSRCEGKQDAERSIQILETPEHLILTQLRFFYDTAKGQRQKVFTNVDFSEELLLPINATRTHNLIDPLSEVGVLSPSTSDTFKNISPMSEDDSESSCSLKEELVGVSSGEASSPDGSYDRYALYGVVVHSGFSSEGGHYYCYARNSSTAAALSRDKDSVNEDAECDWFNFNDERVTKTSFCNISRLTRTFTRDTAYLLFYRKVNLCSNEDRETGAASPVVSEDLSSLSQDLREALELDNIRYRTEQDAEMIRKRSGGSRGRAGGGSRTLRKNDEDDEGGGPAPSSGGTCGDGNGFSLSSREIF